MYAPYAYEGACACVRPPEHIYYGPLVVDILTMADEYCWVIGPTQATVTDTLLSNHRVFDSQETTDGNL